MAEEKMPKMGDAMEEGTIVRWLKKEGDTVEEEEAIAEIQTEKANVEIVAYTPGVLTHILVPEGETVPVGTPIAVIGENGGAPEAEPSVQRPAIKSEAESRTSRAKSAARSARAVAPESLPAMRGAPTERVPERVKASPLARKLATGYGVDLAQIAGTGPGGRILEADVEEFRRLDSPPTVPVLDGDDLADERPMTSIRKVIARRLAESKQTIPHFYLTTDVDAGPLVALRSHLNSARDPDLKISFNDLVVKACAIALTRHPKVNSQLAGDRIRTMRSVHIGVAVSLAEGLIVPVVRGCESRSLTQLSQAIRDRASRARAGSLSPEEYSGGTFTVSNLGMYDVEEFAAVINLPEAAILAVGAIRDVPVIQDNRVVPGKRMKLTISVDHRIVDGAAAAEFLQEIKGLLQRPLALLE